MESTEIIPGMLLKKILFQGTITAVTGLHIGGSNVGLSIGGADATVVRNPLTNLPYIPGSSLKGKMRSLLEKLEGKFGPGIGDQITSGPYTTEPDHIICKLFGTMPEIMKKVNKQGPTSRLIVRDCQMTDDSEKELRKSKSTDMPYTEVKTEVVIDRITSAATPRQLERVPAGTVFEMKLILSIYSGDITEDLVNSVFESLCLVQNDYLGGKGTRGSGEIKIKIDKIGYRDKKCYENHDSNDWLNFKELDKITIPVELI